MALRPIRTLTALGVVMAVVAAGLAVATATAPPAAAQRAITIEGGGWGHGVGMSQYGAKGQAEAGRSYAQILQHYYQGVSVPSAGPWNDVRVLLASVGGTVSVTPRTGANGNLLLPNGSTGTVPAGAELRVGLDGQQRQVVTVNGNPVSGSPFPASSPRRTQLVLGGRNAVVAGVGEYRHGRLEISAGVSGCSAAQCVTVRNMTMDQYLYGLAEMPSSWHAEALKAQAVAGRSYASLRVGGGANRLYDLLPTTAHQVYNGVQKEQEPTYGARWVAAVNATSGRVVQRGGTTVSTLYHSTSGGHTEHSEYVYVAAEPHLRAVADPWDSGSPRHRWSRSYTLADIGSWFGVANVRDVRVGGNVGVSGRIDKATVQIIGASTTRQLTGAQFRATVNARVPDARALWSTKFRILGAGGFPDVPPGSYFGPGVAWLAAEGITDGYGTTGRYEPEIAVTRAQMAAFLWRMMGRPASSVPHGFPDVPAGVYYEPAVRWLAANGITDGYGTTGRYEPDIAVSRAQMATFLHRLAGFQGGAPRHPFPDVPASAYYDRAVSWAFQHGITDGYGTTGRYEPDIAVSRAQMAAFLHRLASRSGAWTRPLPPTAP